MSTDEVRVSADGPIEAAIRRIVREELSQAIPRCGATVETQEGAYFVTLTCPLMVGHPGSHRAQFVSGATHTWSS